jgi:hypothetical protein
MTLMSGVLAFQITRRLSLENQTSRSDKPVRCQIISVILGAHVLAHGRRDGRVGLRSYSRCRPRSPCSPVGPCVMASSPVSTYYSVPRP